MASATRNTDGPSKAAEEIAKQAVYFVKDDSKIVEGALEDFVQSRATILDLSTKWGKAWNIASNFALLIAVEQSQLRRYIVLPDGSFDLAGNSDVYTKLVETDIGKRLDKMVDAEGNPAPISLDVFKSRVQQARSDNKVNFAVAAEAVVESDKALAETPHVFERPVMDGRKPVRNEDGTVKMETVETTVGAFVASNPPGTTSHDPYPEALVERVKNEVFSEQLSAAGNRLPGFSDDDLPTHPGRMTEKEKAAKREAKAKARKAAKAAAASVVVSDIVGTTGEQDDSSNVVPPDVFMLVRWARQTVQSEVLDVILQAVTAASDAAIGAPGKALKGANPVIPGESRKAIVELYAQLGTLAFETGAVVGGVAGASKTDKVAPVRWTEPEAVGVEVEAPAAEPVEDDKADAEKADAEAVKASA